MSDRIQELSLEQLHYDLVQLKSTLTDLPDTLANGMPEIVERKHMNVTVTNPVDEFRGVVDVNGEVKASITNIDQIVNKLDRVILEVKKSKTEEVLIGNPIVVENLSEVSKLLGELVKKDTIVKVAPAQVNMPDKIKIDNWPTDAKNPISVRLSNGERFINQIVQAIGGGSGNALTDAQLRATPVPVDFGGATINASTTESNATNSFGQSLALANGATGTLVSIASSASGYKVKGLIGTGNGDGYFFVQIAGSTVLSGRIRWSQPSIAISLPNPISITTGTAVTLKVTNESGSTADFDGTLLGV